MKKIMIAAACVGLFLSTQSCKEKTEEKVLTKEVKFKKEGSLMLKKAANDSVIANLDIEFADDEYETQTGLMYRTSMANKQAMLFVFDDELTRSFYMKNTEFPLDIIYISGDKKVVNIQKNAKPMDPTSLPSIAPAKYVLEVNGGLSDTWGLEAGDTVDW